MFALMLRERETLGSADLSEVKYVRMGSAPATQGLIDALKACFPRASISLVYGTTESRHNAVYERKAEARPDTDLLGGKERIEDLFEDLCTDACA